MTRPLTDHGKASMTGQLQRLADQMMALIDVAGNLEISCDWYHDADPEYGGPPSVDQLRTAAVCLRAAYLNMALVTGLDPCEQLHQQRNG